MMCVCTIEGFRQYRLTIELASVYDVHIEQSLDSVTVMVLYGDYLSQTTGCDIVHHGEILSLQIGIYSSILCVTDRLR